MDIAFVEDDLDQAEFLKLLLGYAGHKCKHYPCAESFIKAESEVKDCSLFLLDWNLPDKSGLDILSWIRNTKRWEKPVILVSGRKREEDAVAALKSGADDYISKPIRQFEFLARVEAAGRHYHRKKSNNELDLEVGPYTIEYTERRISHNEVAIDLSPKEFELAVLFFRNMNTILSRAYLLERVWGYDGTIHTRTLETHISRLRSKLGFAAHPGWKLTSLHHHGYRLESNV